jgi:uncharacterized membrane protein YdjX (TVP38/TMEM64 family)
MKTALRILILLLIAAGIAAAVVWRHVLDPRLVRDWLALGPFSPLIFVLLQVAASLLFVPRTVLGIAAGLLFGFVWGAVWALVGAMAGAAAGFALVRWFGIGGVLDVSPGVGRLVQRAEHGGWRAVAIVRLTPVPHSVGNTLLAMTRLKWRDYLLGSFAGMLPMTLVQADVGASGGAILSGTAQWMGACLALAAGIVATFLLKRAGRGSQLPPGKLD